MKITDKVVSLLIHLELEPTQLAKDFICARESFCCDLKVVDSNDEWYPIFESEFHSDSDPCYMWNHIEKLGIENVDYNGHFGHIVSFRVDPDKKDSCISIMKELINLWIHVFQSLWVDCGNEELAELVANEAVQKSIREEIKKRGLKL